MPNSSNIYVSVTRALNTSQQQSYHKPRHTWMISVEPHHTHIPGVSRKDAEPIHYAASRDEDSGVHTVNTHSADSEPAIIGNILVAESAKTSPENVRKLLEELLSSKSPSNPQHGGEEEAEHWIQRALNAMQKQKIIEDFDLDEFMTFAHSYEANRMEGGAPALIAYPKVHKHHEKKASKHKFWISTPMADKTRTNNRGEAAHYGGLM